MKKAWYRSASTWLALSILALGMLALLLPGSVFKGPEAPAWAQAIGSVAAIFAAIAYPEYRRRVDQREHVARQVFALWSLGQDIMQHVGPILESLRARNTSPMIEDGTLDHWRQRLANVDLTVLDKDLLRVHSNLSRFVRWVGSNLREVHAMTVTFNSLYEQMGPFVKDGMQAVIRHPLWKERAPFK